MTLKVNDNQYGRQPF